MDITIDYDELDAYLNKKFVAVSDLWDSMGFDSRKVIMVDFAERNIIEMADALKVAKLNWKIMPIEFKLLLISLEIDTDLTPK